MTYKKALEERNKLNLILEKMKSEKIDYYFSRQSGKYSLIQALSLQPFFISYKINKCNLIIYKYRKNKIKNRRLK